MFAVIVEDTHGAHAGTILAAAYVTVGLSVLVHGLSAAPLVGRYADWYQRASGQRRAERESEGAHEHRVRRALTARAG